MEEPQLLVQPKFNPIRYCLNNYLITLLAIIFLMFLTMKQNLIMYFLIIIAVYLVYILIKCFLMYSNYKKIQYLFYTDKLIVLNSTKKGQDTVIFYEGMIDILMVQNFLHKLFDEGELIIKLEEGKILPKNVKLIGITKYKETTQEIYNVVYGQETR